VPNQHPTLNVFEPNPLTSTNKPWTPHQVGTILNLTQRIGDDEVLKIEELELKLQPNNSVVVLNLVPPTSPNDKQSVTLGELAEPSQVDTSL
jgi:hypothetical protein